MNGRIAHYGIRTRNLAQMVEWYRIVLEADVLYRSDSAAFVTFDDEHHRLVLWTDGETIARDARAAGYDHLCIGLENRSELHSTYTRLRDTGVLPTLCVNHRFSTSIYYADPDGNELEFTVDNFATKEEGRSFVQDSEAMEALLVYPFGETFDPERML